MKALWGAVAATIILAGIAGFALNQVDNSSKEQFSVPGVRPPAAADR